MKKKIALFLLFLIGIGVYFIFFQKDKTLRYIPKEADAVILVDVKKLGLQYIFDFLRYPSVWSKNAEQKNEIQIIKNAGIKIPDFLQLFHIKNTQIGSWYTILEIKDPGKFSGFLKHEKFIKIGADLYQKGEFFIRIADDKCVVGNTTLVFQEKVLSVLLFTDKENILNADLLLQGTVASFSTMENGKINIFGIDIHHDEITISNAKNASYFTALESKLSGETQFLKLEMDQRNLQNFSQIFDYKLSDSAEILSVKAIAELEEVNDTILTYEYDDNFNEIEKKSFQKIVQPNYSILLKSNSPEKTWKYFSGKKWINAEDQFTAIPFQPNLILQNKEKISIQSTQKTAPESLWQKQNYFLIKNSILLNSALKKVVSFQPKWFSNVQSVFYTNLDDQYFVKIKLKHDEVPVLLRF